MSKTRILDDWRDFDWIKSLGKPSESGFEPIEQPGYANIMPCNHPEHRPPMYMVIPQGMQYRHVCPGCSQQSIIRPHQVTM